MSYASGEASRDAAIERALPHVSSFGWTWRALRAADVDHEPLEWLPEELFPGGGPEMIEAYCDLADRRMIANGAALNTGLRVSQRLRASLARRLEQNQPHRAALRRAAAIMSLPRHASRAASCTYRTVDALWAVSGDQDVSFSWYTKRVTLALAYSATLLFWLGETSPGVDRTLEFFDRRVAMLRAVGRLLPKSAAR